MASIFLTRLATNTGSFELDASQSKTIVESVQHLTRLNSCFIEFLIVFISFDKSTAPQSSRRGTVSVFTGATLVLAATKVIWLVPFSSIVRMYAHAAYAIWLASQKLWSSLRMI